MFRKYFSLTNFYALLGASIILMGMHASAFAQVVAPVAATTLGDVLTNLYVNTMPFGKMFQYAAYTCGCFCVVQGIHHMRMHTDSPGNTPLIRPLMMFAGAALLLTLPSFVGMVVTTFGYGSAAGGGSISGASCGGGGGLDAMMCNFVNNIKSPLIAFVSMISMVAGIYMIVRGLVKASKYGVDPRTHSMHSILTYILFGGILFSIASNLSMMMTSVFGTSAISNSSVISWSFANALAGGGSAQFKSAVTAALTFFQLIGIIAFVRGWMIMKKVVEGGGNVTMAQGITHIIGGVLAINIFAFLKIMDKTFGTNML